MNIAEAKALGLITDMTVMDGAIGFTSAVPFAFNNSKGVPTGQYDLFGIVAHEMSEVMGRISLLSYYQAYSGLDLFRYSAPGVISTVGTKAAYFSANGGTTAIYSFNTDTAGDFGDLASSTENAYNAFAYTGAILPVTAGDISMMNVLGYNLSAEPNVTSIAENPSTGTVPVGGIIHFTLSFPEAVTVTGTPTLTLNDHAVATYSGGSGTSSLTFVTTVTSTDSLVSALQATALT